jgi:hypothetical protein
MLVPGVEVRISVREYFIAGGALAAEPWSASRRTCMGGPRGRRPGLLPGRLRQEGTEVTLGTAAISGTDGRERQGGIRRNQRTSFFFSSLSRLNYQG